MSVSNPTGCQQLSSTGVPRINTVAPDTAEECYAFASFRLLPRQRTLLRGDELVAIGGRAFDMLLLLVSRAGVVVSLNDLMSFVWPAVTVEEANLRVQMGMLRKILSQCEDATRAIETIPLRGYCFILPVRHHPNGVEAVDQRHLAQASLPILLNATIGRDEAIEAVIEALDDQRLVTITGPGGIGKTTVAVASARRYSAAYAGGICFVDLSHATTGEIAASAIADALGLKEDRDTLAALSDNLGAREVLLVLDTCEHLVEPMASVVETLLAHCAHLRVMVTSREPLRATGEWTIRLASLTYPDANDEPALEDIGRYSAISLFTERVRASMRFTMSDRDLPLVSEICRRLDGIPLALEFAAARVADLGLREVASHLDDRFAILTRGRRTALPRHRTLSAAFDWSYSLLGLEEQRMLSHLAVIGGSFDVEKAIAMGRELGCGQPAEALAGLYDKSLLSIETRDGSPAYRMLDTTRAYVRGRAEPLGLDSTSRPLCNA